MTESIPPDSTNIVQELGHENGNGTVASDTSKLNGLFDIADIAETLTAAREERENNEQSVKKQRQQYNVDLSVNNLNASLPDRGEQEGAHPILTSNPTESKLEGTDSIPSMDVNNTPLLKSPSPSDRPAPSYQDQLSPTEQKQQLQLPLRKRHHHLLASSANNIPDSQGTTTTSISTTSTTTPTTDSPPATSSSPILDVTSPDEPIKTTTTTTILQRSPQISSKPPPTPTPPTSLPAKGTSLMDLYLPPRRSKKPSFNEPSASASSSRPSGRGRGGGGRGRRTKTTAGDNAGTASPNLYCLCKQPYDPTNPSFMICCDTCDEWYHGACVGITQKESKKIGKYVCPKCKPVGSDNSNNNNNASPTGQQVKTENSPRGSSSSNKKRSGDETPNEESIKRTRTDPSAISKRPVASPLAGDEAYATSDRKCVHCNDAMAKIGSKYCSEDCSMAVARELVRKKQEEGNGVSAADTADMGMLEDIAKRKAEIEEKLRKLEKEQEELEKVIQMNSKRNTSRDTFSPPISPLSQSLTSPYADSPHSSASSSPLPPSSPQISATGSNDAEDNSQKENAGYSGGDDMDDTEPRGQGHSNKRLSGAKRKMPKRQQGDEICGCPTTDFSSGYCELMRKNCVKHVNWEDMKRGSLEHEKKQHQGVLGALVQEELQVRTRMARRKERAVDAHRTIIEA